jgi:hypothetical protein
MERYCSADQSPQRAVAPTEEEEDIKISFKTNCANGIVLKHKNNDNVDI